MTKICFRRFDRAHELCLSHSRQMRQTLRRELQNVVVEHGPMFRVLRYVWTEDDGH